MLYTLLKFLGWGALLAFIGGCIGWALRSLKCRGEVSRVRVSTVDEDEVERMRHRVANLEQVVAERDRLRIQLADVRHSDSPGIVGGFVPEAPIESTADDSLEDIDQGSDSDTEDDPGQSDPGQSDPGQSDPGQGASEAIVEADSRPSAPDAVPSESEQSDVAAVGGLADTSGESTAPDDAVTDEAATDEAVIDEAVIDEAFENAPDPAPAEAVLDLGAAAAVIGKKVELDDLTVVEGIGPKISELCSGIGVHTWRKLADTDVAELQSMLDAAGSRYTVHKPATWPEQAELLATGQWDAFVALTGRLDRGK